MEYHKPLNEFTIAAFSIAILSLIGSLLSLFNAIPLMIGYQLLQEAKNRGISKKQEQIVSTLLEAAMLLTLCITVLYITLQI
ncbi:hypothetical protein [Candidatus Stoquefichus sp. SB1]|jgi:hypothetical protein|uniref:hypothetical protein n=1 Tax=Candidatus Stoquefichus sp. SB1 TaxID=1658109 RepID=UPI00067F34E7|nr:hypothetical protein [Candidatus Stoquefichus sp. SB1]